MHGRSKLVHRSLITSSLLFLGFLPILVIHSIFVLVLVLVRHLVLASLSNLRLDILEPFLFDLLLPLVFFHSLLRALHQLRLTVDRNLLDVDLLALFCLRDQSKCHLASSNPYPTAHWETSG